MNARMSQPTSCMSTIKELLGGISNFIPFAAFFAGTAYEENFVATGFAMHLALPEPRALRNEWERLPEVSALFLFWKTGRWSLAWCRWSGLLEPTGSRGRQPKER